MKRQNLFIVIVFLCLSNLVYSQNYKEAFNKFLSYKELKNANVSLYMQNVNTKEVVFAYNENTSVIPASIFKIFSTSIALDIFGPKHKFKTEIAYSGKIDTVNKVLNGNIYIIGGGDPCLGSPNYKYNYETNNKDIIEQWADKIVKLGIKKINGNIIADVSYFGKIDTPNRWLWQDIENFYGNSGSALNYADNMYYIHYETGASDGSATKVQYVVPNDLEIEIDNNVLSSNYSGDEAYIYKGDSKDQKTVKGTLPINKKDFVIKGSFPDVELYVANKLLKYLKKKGVENSNEALLLTTDDKIKKTVITTTYSPELITIITNVNQKSNNMYSQVLSYHIEKKMNTNYSKAVTKYFINHNLSDDGLYVDDACGLSRANTLTSKLMSDYFNYLRTSYPYKEEFKKTLAVNGISGTLKNFSLNSNVKIVAKTGTLFRVASYSGYLTDKNKNEFVFCFVVNNFNCSYYNIQQYYKELFNNIGNAK